MNFFNFRF